MNKIPIITLMSKKKSFMLNLSPDLTTLITDRRHSRLFLPQTTFVLQCGVLQGFEFRVMEL